MNTHRILLVDDSAMNREILSSMLEGEYHIVEAENGLQAIEILERRAYAFSLVLLDIVMPEYDGYEVLSYMQQNGLIEDLPVVVISSEMAQNRVNRAYDMGAVDFISRPYDAFIVKRRVRNTIALYEKQKRLTSIVANEIYERTKGYDQMLSILSQIVEFRNQESGLHVMHIKTLTRLLARQLANRSDRYALTPLDIERISIASSLHDIGKITVPDAILNKPGRLTKDEFAIIKTHSAVGAQMIKRMSAYQNDPMIQTAHDICRWHHERYDGKGYPDGLVGDQIPISAQIVSLADVYDALTEERCYKKAFPHEKAIEMIINGACGAFNPLLLTCLTEISGRLKKQWSGGQDEARRREELAQLTEKLSKYDDLTVSYRITRQLQYEQSRADYYEHMAGDNFFAYRDNSPILRCSAETARLLGIKEMTMGAECLSHLFERLSVPREAWLQRLTEATPEYADFVLDGKLKREDTEVCCAVLCHTVWLSGEPTQYAGVVGTIRFL